MISYLSVLDKSRNSWANSLSLNKEIRRASSKGMIGQKPGVRQSQHNRMWRQEGSNETVELALEIEAKNYS